MRRCGSRSSDLGAQTTPGASSGGAGGWRASARGSIAPRSRAEVWRAAFESLRFPGSDCDSVSRPGSSAMIRSSRVDEARRLGESEVELRASVARNDVDEPCLVSVFAASGSRLPRRGAPDTRSMP